jgi:hypothetical protein
VGARRASGYSAFLGRLQLEDNDNGERFGLYGKYAASVHLADGAERTEPGSLPFDYRLGFGALKK